MYDIIKSLILEANPTLPSRDVEHLIDKYIVVIWDRAKEVIHGKS